MLDLRLMLAGFIGLTGLGMSALLLQRGHEREQQWQARIQRVIDPHTPRPQTVAAPPFRIGLRSSGTKPWQRAVALFGFHPEQRDHYPVRWWIVLPAALLGARLVAGIITNFLGGASLLFIVPIWILLSRQVFKWFDDRRRDALFRQFPDALAMIVRSVRVGIPVSEAIRLVARESVDPTRREFAIIADKIAIGMLLDEALQQMGMRNNMPEYRFFATALSLQSQTGGGLAETLENLADVIRKRVAMRERGHALASEAKTSAGILAALPVFAGFGLALINPGYIGVLVFDPSGKRLMGIALGMLAGGIMVMRSLIRRSLT
jgi:tight adherence protein B